MPRTRNMDKNDLEENDELVRADIEKLKIDLPKVSELFDVHRRIGEGTFSTVYLATSKGHKEKRYALKHVVPTCHPDRIMFELQCLKNIGNSNNVVGVHLCLREKNSVVFVMSYLAHEKFCDYVGKMDCKEVAEYMKNLLIALSHVHKFNIIHRDVKPSNFLYDRINRRYLLVDFGLAQTEKECKAHGKKRKRESDCEVQPESKRILLKENHSPTPIENQQKASSYSNGNKLKMGLQETQLKLSVANVVFKKSAPKTDTKSCKCYGKPMTCSKCVTRKNLYAARAGTPGFRPPEVLLKSQEQTTAVDVWAAGIIFLTILSNCNNFFASPDDVTALAEMITVFGYDALRKVAMLCGCHLICSENKPGMDLRKLSCLLRARNGEGTTFEKAICENCGHSTCLCVYSKADLVVKDEFPEAAYDFLKILLDVNPYTRISAGNALNHKFFQDIK